VLFIGLLVIGLVGLLSQAIVTVGHITRSLHEAGDAAEAIAVVT